MKADLRGASSGDRERQRFMLDLFALVVRQRAPRVHRDLALLPRPRSGERAVDQERSRDRPEVRLALRIREDLVAVRFVHEFRIDLDEGIAVRDESDATDLARLDTIAEHETLLAERFDSFQLRTKRFPLRTHVAAVEPRPPREALGGHRSEPTDEPPREFDSRFFDVDRWLVDGDQPDVARVPADVDPSRRRRRADRVAAVVLRERVVDVAHEHRLAVEHTMYVVGDAFERDTHILIAGRSTDREYTDIRARHNVVRAATEPDLHE